ncbi:hypothetical protein NDU88_005590 [Pleurodeles waltl]|uniref:Uncharacterized protein n=1 Tax=Pleurodeles waltl TaxID=8319 RepID=A0AAV7N4U9_PLEWA|nr:hypothetical protein NDU88_005590 [Pleurodeles waltl]
MKKTDRLEEATQPEKLIALDTAVSPNDTEPDTRTFLEALFGALLSDITTLKQDLTKDIQGLTKDINELGDPRANCDAQGEELDSHRREILELQEENTDLQYQVEDLEKQSQRANIRIKGVPVGAAGGNLEDYTRRLIHSIAPELAPQEFTIDRVYGAGRLAKSPGQPQDI